MARVRFGAPAVPTLVLAAMAFMAAGCGSTSHAVSHHTSSASHTTSTSSPPTATREFSPPTTVPKHAPRPADARTVAVIRHWADALRHGHVRAAAGYFEIPSVFAPGPDQEVTLHSLHDAEIVNAELPCGAKLISVVRVGGPLVQALFRLTGRPGRGGSSCNPGAGETARTNFVIKAGRIRVWIRAPDEPGDNQGAAPGDSQGGGPTV